MCPVLALLPGAPVLVPELAGSATADTASEVTRATELLAAALDGIDRVTVIGAGDLDETVTGGRTSLRRWGADVTAGHGEELPATESPDALVLAWWWLDRAGYAGARTFATPDLAPPAGAQGQGAVIAIADGPASLADRAPVPTDPRGVDLDAALTAWISGGGELPDPGPDVADAVGWWSRAVWRDLAARRTAGGHRTAGHIDWSPFGVGYHVAVWTAENPS